MMSCIFKIEEETRQDCDCDWQRQEYGRQENRLCHFPALHIPVIKNHGAQKKSYLHESNYQLMMSGDDRPKKIYVGPTCQPARNTWFFPASWQVGK
jgi:hypothetical protein